MLLLWGVAIGLVAGRVAGGRWSRLADLPVRGTGWIFAVLALQLALFSSPLAVADWAVTAGPWLFVASIAVLAWQMARNRHLGRGVDLVLAGLLLNLTVITINGGRMPARVDLLESVRGRSKAQAVTSSDRSAYAEPLNDSSRLAWLGDQIPVRLPGGHGNVYSIGDVLVSAGLGYTLFRGARRAAGAAAAGDGDATSADGAGLAA
jgi:hypothetical protein